MGMLLMSMLVGAQSLPKASSQRLQATLQAHDRFMLINAVKKNDQEKVAEILNQPMAAVLVNTPDESGRTALHYALLNPQNAPYGNLKMVRLLLDKGANVNVADAQGQTALHYAMRNPQDATHRYVTNNMLKNADLDDPRHLKILHENVLADHNDSNLAFIVSYFRSYREKKDPNLLLQSTFPGMEGPQALTLEEELAQNNPHTKKYFDWVKQQ